MEQQKQQKRENGGYLFRNADKRTDKQPDFRGKMNISGKEWLISGWTRTKDGAEMISISLTDPSTLPARDPGAAPKTSAAGPFAKNQGSTTPSAAPKSFQPPSAKSAPAPAASNYDDLEDLDNLFNGLDDQ